MIKTYLMKQLKKIKDRSGPMGFGREIVKKWSLLAAEQKTDVKILDIGCGHGEDLTQILSVFGERSIECYGMDSLERHVRDFPFTQLDVPRDHVVQVNIEKDKFPFPDNFFDLVIANQVLEHTKELFWIVSEMARVLKPNGFAIIGVPNLASLHNRLLLLAGEQPSCIEIYGPHVRGFTISGVKRFIERSGCFCVKQVAGDHYYPFSKKLGTVLSQTLPSSSVLIYFLLQKDGGKPCLFSQELAAHPFETEFRH